MKKIFNWSMLLIIFVFVLSGCNTNENTSKPTSEQQTGQYPMKIKDATGEAIHIKAEPKKVVSLIPSNTEILFALGSGNQVVGVSDNDNYPKEAAAKEKVGGMEFNVEKIISLKPDIVFAHSTIADSAESGLQQLRELGIIVFVVKEAKNFEETYDMIATFGVIMNERKEADHIIAQMKDKVDSVQKKVKAVKQQRSAFVETSDAPEIYTAGKGTFIQEMFDLLNIKNVATKTGWYQISSEAIIKDNPDVILVMYDYVPKIVEKVKQRDGFQTITAVQNDQVVQIESDPISRTGPRLADGLEELAKAVYPEAFNK